MANQADRNLLLGILALQLDFITRDQLVAAMNAWILQKNTPLDAVLRSQNALADDAHALLNALVAKHLALHGDDPQRSLAALPSVASIHRELSLIADPEVEASLAAVRRAPSPSHSDVTATFSVGDATAEGKRFRILRPHARGGLGEVFVAHDGELNREVALKEIQPDHADDAYSRARFLLEAEITGGLEHPGIVPVYGLGQYDDGRPFYAMRFIRGDSLKEAVDRFHASRNAASRKRERPEAPGAHASGSHASGSLESADFRKLLGRFVDVCNAIEYAHSRGVLHRDLKPGNIMLGKYGETLVVDWGLAKAQGREEKAASLDGETTLRPRSGSGSSVTRMGEVVGTPAYMSPEQAAGRLDQLGSASDVYSLGATLYYVLTGQTPFERGEAGDLLRRVERGEFPAPRTIKPEIPKPLEAICLRAMAREPVDRYASPHDLADDVERYLADEPLAALPDSLPDHLSRLARRHRTLVRSAAAALFVIAVVSTVAFFTVNEQRRANAKLAGDNGALAIEKGKLAEEKGALAERNATLLASEREAKAKVEEANTEINRQLRHATALRLAAQSANVRQEFPQRAGLLAIAAANATRAYGEPVLPEAHQSLLDAHQTLQGEPLVACSDPLVVGVSADNRWLISLQPGAIDETERMQRWPPDPGYRFSANNAQKLHMWDMHDWPHTQPRVLHEGPILTSPTISENHRWLVLPGPPDARQIQIWDLTAEDPVASRRALAIDGFARRITISDDGRWLLWKGIVSGKFAIELRDLTNSRHFPLDAKQAALTNDGRCLAIVDSQSTLKTFDLTEPKTLSTERQITKASEVTGGLLISPDHRWLVGLTRDARSMLWDLTPSGPAEPRLLHHERRAALCAFNPDSRSFAMILETPEALAGENSVIVWSLDSAATEVSSRVYRCPVNAPSAFAFSPQGEWLAAAPAGTSTWLLNTRLGQTYRLLGHEQAPLRAAFAPNGSLYASCNGHAMRRWSLSPIEPVGRTHWRSDVPSLDHVAVSAEAARVVLSGPRGFQFLRVGADQFNASWLADRRSDQLLQQDLEGKRYRGVFTSRGERVAFHPQYNTLAVLNTQLELWDPSEGSGTPRVLATFDPGACMGPRSEVHFSPDGRFLFYNVEPALLRFQAVRFQELGVIDLAAKNPNPQTLLKQRITANALPRWRKIAVAPDSRHLVEISEGGQTALLFDLHAANIEKSGKVLSPPNPENDRVTAVSALPGGRVGIGIGHRIALCDLRDEKPQWGATLSKPGMYEVAGIVPSRDGRWLIGNPGYNGVVLFDLQSSDSRWLAGHEGTIHSVAISDDSRWVATGGADGMIRLFDLRSPEPSRTQRVIRAHDGGVLTVAFSPDAAHLLSAGRDNGVAKWDLDVATLSERLQQSAARLLTSNEMQEYVVPELTRPDLQACLLDLLVSEHKARAILQRGPINSFSAEQLRDVRNEAQKATARLASLPGSERFGDAVRAREKLASTMRTMDRILAAVEGNLESLTEESFGKAESPALPQLFPFRFYDECRRERWEEALRTLEAMEHRAQGLMPFVLSLYSFLGDSLDRAASPAETKTNVRQTLRSQYLSALRRGVLSGVSFPTYPQFLRHEAEVLQSDLAGGGRLLRRNLAYQPNPRPVRWVEGESLNVVDRTGDGLNIQDMHLYAPTVWSGGKHLFWGGGEPGSRLILSFEVPRSGIYDLKARFTKAPDFAIVKLLLDDLPVRNELDLYRRTVALSEFIELGRHRFEPGEHRLTVEITGANSAATARKFALDCIALYDAEGAAFPIATASYTYQIDAVEKANDGIVQFKWTPHNRWTSFASPTATDWLQLEFEQETAFSRVELAIYDESPGSGYPDAKGGGVRAPSEYVVEYLDGNTWKPVVVKSRKPEKPTGGMWNDVRFEPVLSKKVRVVFTHEAPYKSGITEIAVWKTDDSIPDDRGVAFVAARAMADDAAGALALGKELAAKPFLDGPALVGRRLLPMVRAQFSEEIWASDAQLVAFWKELKTALEAEYPAPPAANVDGIELWWADANQQVVGKDLGDGKPLQVEGQFEKVRSIQWSGDAKTLVTLDAMGFWKERTEANEEQVRQIEAHHFAASPDRDRYAIVRSEGPKLLIGDRHDNAPAELGFGHDPHWFADGQRLAYLGWNGAWRLAVWDGKETAMSPAPFRWDLYVYPCPSPDGKSIAFGMQGNNGTLQIGLLSLEGKFIRQVTCDGGHNTFPSFAADGRLLAFIRSRDSKHELRTIDLETLEETLIAEDVALQRPAWRRRPEK